MPIDPAASPSRRRLHFVQICREAISRRFDGVEQHKGADLAAVTGAVDDDVHEHFKAVHKLVVVAVKAHRVDPKLHRVLAEQIPRVGKLEKLESFNRENFTWFSTYLERHRGELRVDDLGLASFVCVTAIEALTHNAVLHYSNMLSDGTMEALIEEAARLVTGYLKK